MFVVTLIVGSFDANFESDVCEVYQLRRQKQNFQQKMCHCFSAIAIREGRSVKADSD